MALKGILALWMAVWMYITLAVDHGLARSVYIPNVDALNGGCVARMWTWAGVSLDKSLKYEVLLRLFPVPVELFRTSTTSDDILRLAGVSNRRDREKFMRCFGHNRRPSPAACREFQECGGHGRCGMGFGAVSRYMCQCDRSHSGPNCEQRITFTTTTDYCSSNPCKNGATCALTGSGYNCSCPMGYKGRRCEQAWLTERMFSAMVAKQTSIEELLKRMMSQSTALVENQREQMKASGTVYYKLFSEKVQWTQAVARCQREGGVLASVRSNEQHFMVSTLRGMEAGSLAWLGGSDMAEEGAWRWRNGDPFRYQQWHPDQLMHGHPLEHCLVLARDRDGNGSFWDDFACSHTFSFICEFH